MEDKLKLVVTGGRDYDDYETVNLVLSAIHLVNPITLLINGKAKGADSLCRQWAIDHQVPVQDVEPDWNNLDVYGAVIRKNKFGYYNARAGHMRNQQMIDEFQPDYAIIFPGGTGTADMKDRIMKAKIKYLEVPK